MLITFFINSCNNDYFCFDISVVIFYLHADKNFLKVLIQLSTICFPLNLFCVFLCATKPQQFSR